MCKYRSEPKAIHISSYRPPGIADRPVTEEQNVADIVPSLRGITRDHRVPVTFGARTTTHKDDQKSLGPASYSPNYDCYASKRIPVTFRRESAKVHQELSAEPGSYSPKYQCVKPSICSPSFGPRKSAQQLEKADV